ncbi:MAG: cell division protein FtsQ [Opitutaceae bacterium]|nr:cell division protein FtsQ [Cytophagales bacterium]
MILNTNIKTLIQISIAIVILLGLFGFANSKQGDMRVVKADVYVKQAYDNYFIDEKDVMALMTIKGTEVLEEEAFKKLSFKELEKRIKENLFVEDVQVYRDVKGNLYAKVVQRKPIFRIARSYGKDFYVDTYGNIFPISDKFTARVLIADGPYMNKLLSKGFKKDSTNKNYLEFIKKVENDKFLNSQIHQISVDNLGRINMYQQVGSQVIEFGYPDKFMEAKFKKLKVFYERILPAKGWNAYKRVNLNYENQIVCE